MRKNFTILIYDDLVEPLIDAIEKIKEMKSVSQNITEKYLIESLFSYTFSTFEGTLLEIIEQITYAFPQKLSLSNVNNENLMEIISSNNNLEEVHRYIASSNVHTVSYKSLDEILKTLSNLTGVKVNLDASQKKKLLNYKSLRNLLTHKNLKIDYKYLESIGKTDFKLLGMKIDITQPGLTDNMDLVIYILEDVLSQLKVKYSKYTKLKLLKDLWYSMFNSPLLNFDSYWITDENTRSIHFNLEKGTKHIDSLSSYETTLLAIWLQQYNTDLVGNYVDIKKTRFWMPITDEIEGFLRVIRRYPHIFMKIK